MNKNNNNLKKLNIEKFKNILSSQINYVNKDIIEDIDNKITDILSKFDEVFINSKSKKDLKEIEEFKIIIENIKGEIFSFLNGNEELIQKIIKDYRNTITNSILNKKENKVREIYFLTKVNINLINGDLNGYLVYF